MKMDIHIPARKEVNLMFDNIYWDCLSMGMSSDFETAIQYGATHIRIGSSIFGERI